MGSSRLPGKVLADIGGAPALTRLLRRLRACRKVDDVVLATSTGKVDDALADWAHANGVAVYRGSEDDVLHRVVHAQRQMQSDIVVEVTGDCPLLDPEIIDLGVETFLRNECDVVTNARIPSYPQGADVQVFRLDALEEVERTISDPAVREHVSLYFYEHPERYRVIHLMAPHSWHDPDQRLQLDYEEDLRLIREIYGRLEPRYGGLFGVARVIDLLRNEPSLRAINAHCVEKSAR